MKVRAWLALALILCLTVSLAACGSNDTAVYVQSVSDLTGMGGIAAGDRFPGMVVSENVTEIKKDSEKTVKEVLVKEGDDVNKGDKLFEYDTDELQLSLEKKQLELEQLNATLEFRDYPGLYGAGQFNGSSGYEEAAAQGFVAGANAALKVLNRDPLILDRAGSYIGTLIDDLITKGVTDPYRMMTSRSEYRLVLRQDNADERLTPIGRELGLIDDRRWAKFEKKQAQKEAEMKRAEKTVFSPTDALNEVLVSCETSPVTTGVRLSELLRRPQVTYADLTPIDIERPNYPREIFESVETALKYEGYIKRQLQDIAEMRRLEKKLLPKEINYDEISGLRLEAQEKLNRVRPENVGQAGRISGVSPADISVLLIWLSAHNEEK